MLRFYSKQQRRHSTRWPKPNVVGKIDGADDFDACMQWANLSYSSAPDLTYVKGGLIEVNVDPIEVDYTFSPIQGDIENDGDVDILDIRTVAAYYEIEEGDPSWNAASAPDLNCDDIIDLFDIVIIANNFGYEYP
jgi:hypothetical protein